jgi:hypothetical protein
MSTVVDASPISLPMKPPMGWRFALWACVGATIAGWIIIVGVAFLAAGLSLLALLAGSPNGMHAFFLELGVWGGVGILPIVLFVILLLFRPYVRSQFAPASAGQRIAIALGGLCAGSLIAIAITLVSWLF